MGRVCAVKEPAEKSEIKSGVLDPSTSDKDIWGIELEHMISELALIYGFHLPTTQPNTITNWAKLPT